VTLGNITVSSLIDYIYDIFSFNKYRKDNKTHLKISASLARNINDFIRDNKQREKVEFTSEMAIEALTYCIQHNDMFSVQYDVEKPHKNPTQPQEISNPPTPPQQVTEKGPLTVGGQEAVEE
jgi:hypothetical protein